MPPAGEINLERILPFCLEIIHERGLDVKADCLLSELFTKLLM